MEISGMSGKEGENLLFGKRSVASLPVLYILIGSGVGIDLQPVAVGVAEVERPADTVIHRMDRNPHLPQLPVLAGKHLPIRHFKSDMKQARAVRIRSCCLIPKS